MGIIPTPIFYTENAQEKRFGEVEMDILFTDALISPSRYARDDPREEDKYFMDYLSKEVGGSENLFERISIANTIKPEVEEVLRVVKKIRKWIGTAAEYKSLITDDNDYYFLDVDYFSGSGFANDLQSLEEMLLASPADALVDCEFGA